MTNPMVSSRSQAIINFLAQNGLDTKDGAKILQRARRGNANIGKFDEAGWGCIGILKSDPKLDGGIKFFDIDVGFIVSTLAKVFKGRKPVLDIELMCMTPEGLKLAFGTSGYQLIEPAVPIATTVDDATDPTSKRIKVEDVTGFLIGHRIAILTREADYDPDYELKTIEDIDPTNKIIILVQPLEHLPVDGAAVKVIERSHYDIGEAIVEDAQYRIVEFYKNSTGIYHMPHGALSKDGFPQGGMEAPQTASPQLEIMKDWDVDSNNVLTTNYLTYDEIYPLTF